MQAMRRKRDSGKGAPARPVRPVRSVLAERAAPAEEPRVPRAEARRAPARGSRAEAIDVILSTATELQEGFRHAVVGLPRHGKTYHLQDLLEQAIARGVGRVAYVHDVKKATAQYAGSVRENVAALRAHPLQTGESPVIVFHPSLTTAQRPTVEDVAQIALQTARAGIPSILCIDEAAKAVKVNSQILEATTAGEVVREGSSQGCSACWTGQDPASWPREFRAMAETTAIFRVLGGVLSYVMDQWRLPRHAEQVIAGLQVGEFILVTLEGWDGRVFGPA